MYRALPKFVGKPTGPGHYKTIYNIISTDALAQVTADVAANGPVNFAALQQAGLATKSKWTLHKVVLGGKTTTDAPPLPKLTVQAHAFTASARAAIEGSGGLCELLSKTTHKVLGSVDDSEVEKDDDSPKE